LNSIIIEHLEEAQMLKSNFVTNFFRFMLVLALAMTVSCAKKKPAEGEGEVPPGGDTSGQDTAISDKEMKFDAQGSDSESIAGLKTIYFTYDSSTLSPEARETLSGNAAWLKKNADYNLQIEGHCDSRGSIEYNLALGERRAKSVRTYLTNLGVGGKRLSIISYGKEKPIAAGDSDQAASKNRRANFLPLGK
jgi:peptidoglycan-associated lipoprotein